MSGIRRLMRDIDFRKTETVNQQRRLTPGQSAASA